MKILIGHQALIQGAILKFKQNDNKEDGDLILPTKIHLTANGIVDDLITVKRFLDTRDISGEGPLWRRIVSLSTDNADAVDIIQGMSREHGWEVNSIRELKLQFTDMGDCAESKIIC